MSYTIQNQFRFGILVAIFGVVFSCLITNCPRGGKRSELIRNNEHGTPSECISCGPENEGVCLGRNICCGKEMGCLASPTYSKPCQNLTTVKTSCLLGLTASTCGENGYCRAKYLCCTKDRCTFDPSCKSTPYTKYKNFYERLPPVLEPNVQPLAQERNLMGKYESEVNMDEIQRAKPDFPVSDFDYV